MIHTYGFIGEIFGTRKKSMVFWVHWSKKKSVGILSFFPISPQMYMHRREEKTEHEFLLVDTAVRK